MVVMMFAPFRVLGVMRVRGVNGVVWVFGVGWLLFFTFLHE